MSSTNALTLRMARAFDNKLLMAVLLLLMIGCLMIISTSIPYAEKNTPANPWYFVQRHFIYLALAMVAALITLSIPIVFWRKYGLWLLGVSIALLVLVLILFWIVWPQI